MLSNKVGPMNFRIVLKKQARIRINAMAKALYRGHSSAKCWPPGFFDFTPIEEVPDFTSFRQDLKANVFEDPIK